MNRTTEERIEQFQSKKVPEGYKKTKAGVIPEEWEVVRIEDCLERVGTPVAVKPTTHYTQIGIRSHGKGLFYKEPITGEEIGNKAVFWIEPDCFILNIVFAWEQAIGKTTEKERGMIGSHRFPMYRPIDNKVDIDYLIYYFLTKRGTEILEAASPGGAGRNRTLGQDRFMRSKIVLPPLEEQKKIAQILSDQDKVIELQDRKIEQLQHLKKYCLAKLFPQKGTNVPEIRFPEFSDPWEQCKFGELCSIVTKQTGFDYTEIIKESLLTEESEGTLPYLQTKNFAGVSIDYKTDYYIPKSVAKEFPKINLDEKCLLFSIVGASVGNIGLFPGDKHCFLSGAICVSKLLNQNDTDFLYHYMCSECGQSQIRNCIKGGAQATITIEDIREFNVLLPSEDERMKVGQFLTKLDKTIALHQRKRDGEVKKKKALMQLLLTGVVRV